MDTEPADLTLLRVLPATARIFSLVTTVEGFRRDWAIEEVCKEHGWHLPPAPEPLSAATKDMDVTTKPATDLAKPQVPMPTKDYMDKFRRSSSAEP